MKKQVLMLLLASLAGGVSLAALPLQAESERVVESIPDDAPPPAEPKRIYRHVGKDGSVVFSDAPAEGSEEMTVQEPNSVKLHTPYIPKAPKEQVKAARQYTLRITAPKGGKHYHNHFEPVEVSVGVSPQPRPEHTLEVTDNGASLPKTDGKYIIELLSPGEHRINARVIDEKGEVLGSAEPVVFYAHRAKRN